MMCKKVLLFISYFFPSILLLNAQEVRMSEKASLDQAYGKPVKSENLKPFNDISVESGYVLYEAEIVVESDNPVLELENVRDYAIVYVDSTAQGEMTNSERKITLQANPGKHRLQIYAENIGRITYGPEILDNLKGIFGEGKLNGRRVTGWKITPLRVKELEVQKLTFSSSGSAVLPGFRKGVFDMSTPKDTYLDMAGWGMGEVWINGQYLGSFWEKEKLQSIQVVAGILKESKNEIVIFELKNYSKNTVRFVDKPVFN